MTASMGKTERRQTGQPEEPEEPNPCPHFPILPNAVFFSPVIPLWSRRRLLHLMRRKCSLVGGQVEGGPGGNSAHASHCTVGCEREIGGRSSLESERGQSETTVHCVTKESCLLLQCSGLKTSRPTSTLLLNCTIKASAQANFHSALASQQKAVRGSLSSP